MQVINNELTALFDVDDTLVMHGLANHPEAREFKCPYTNKIEWLVPHRTHIQILKQQKGRGYHITVWSAGGWEWAKTVVELLELTEFVDEIRSKPIKFFDDQTEGILGSRVYINFKKGNE